MDKQQLFVYGKLRKGGALPMDQNFQGAEFVGNATVNGKLYDLGQFPGLVIDNSETTVHGAVYEVDDGTLLQLDEIEASAEYYRQIKQAFMGEKMMRCWIYLPDPQKCTDDKLIASGDWIEHYRSRD